MCEGHPPAIAKWVPENGHSAVISCGEMAVELQHAATFTLFMAHRRTWLTSCPCEFDLTMKHEVRPQTLMRSIPFGIL